MHSADPRDMPQRERRLRIVIFETNFNRPKHRRLVTKWHALQPDQLTQRSTTEGTTS